MTSNALGILQLLGIKAETIEEKEFVFSLSTENEKMIIPVPDEMLALVHECLFDVTGSTTNDTQELINLYKASDFFTLASNKTKSFSVFSDSNASAQLNALNYASKNSFLVSFRNDAVNVFKSDIKISHKLQDTSFPVEKGVIKYLLIKLKP